MTPVVAVVIMLAGVGVLAGIFVYAQFAMKRIYAEEDRQRHIAEERQRVIEEGIRVKAKLDQQALLAARAMHEAAHRIRQSQ